MWTFPVREAQTASKLSNCAIEAVIFRDFIKNSQMDICKFDEKLMNRDVIVFYALLFLGIMCCLDCFENIPKESQAIWSDCS